VLSIRKAAGLRVRLPLTNVTIATPSDNIHDVLKYASELIQDEVNVKEVTATTDMSAAGEFVLAVKPGVVGPRVGGKVQQILAAARKNEWTQNDDGTVTVAGEQLQDGEFDLRFRPLDETSSRALPGNTGVVVLDVNVTPELAQEGIARDVVRLVQSARRDAGLEVSDHIRLNITATAPVAEAINVHESYVAAQTLADHITLSENPTGDFQQSAEVDGDPVVIGVTRI
jgi:isoleucyl-tRNA synthetase